MFDMCLAQRGRSGKIQLFSSIGQTRSRGEKLDYMEILLEDDRFAECVCVFRRSVHLVTTIFQKYARIFLILPSHWLNTMGIPIT